ncbi:MAG: MCE family protein [Kiritimatiellales bacterium]|nr:MCE family protein [Kiritimatiellales bacterium]
MKKYKHEITIEIMVGLFMFIVLIALGVFTIVLSRDNLFKTSYEYEFVFSEVGGLREGDNVYLRGMSIGRVRQTELKKNRVAIFVSLDVPITLRRGYEVEVVDASMLGGKYLKIYEGPEDAPLLGDNVTILGSKPFDIITDLGEAVKGLQSMITAVSEGQGTLGKLLQDDALYDNMVMIGEDLKDIGTRIQDGEGTLGKLLYDETLSEDLEATMTSIRSISEAIDHGDGTLGKLVRDAKLYDEAALMVEDVRAAVDDLREASPITSFGSVLFGAF